LRKLKGHSVGINSISIEKVKFASGADEGSVKYWDISSLEPLRSFDAH